MKIKDYRQHIEGLAKMNNPPVNQCIALLRQLYGKLVDMESEHRWIPVSEKLPEMREVDKHVMQSSWVHITEGVNVIEAYYYDYTKREAKPNYATGKGWYCHGMKKSDITHWKPIILPKQKP